MVSNSLTWLIRQSRESRSKVWLLLVDMRFKCVVCTMRCTTPLGRYTNIASAPSCLDQDIVYICGIGANTAQGASPMPAHLTQNMPFSMMDDDIPLDLRMRALWQL